MPCLSQNLEIVEIFRQNPTSTVLANYKNAFSDIVQNTEDMDEFPYALIYISLQGNEQEVKKAKEKLRLDGGSHAAPIKVITHFDGDPNAILALVPKGGRKWFLQCGEGCMQQMIIDHSTPLESNTVWKGTVHYTPVPEIVLQEQSYKNNTQYIKFNIQPKDANASVIVHLKGEDIRLSCPGKDGIFVSDHVHPEGTYTYTVTAPKYHSQKGSMRHTIDSNPIVITLLPKFGWIDVVVDAPGTSSNAHASVEFFDARSNELKMNTEAPIQHLQLESGTYTMRVHFPQYKSAEQTIVVTDNHAVSCPVQLQPNFALIILKAEHPDTEIYIDNLKKGNGTWSGRLDYGDYVVETRRKNHKSVYTKVQVLKGKEGTQEITLKSPTPRYGSLQITGNPSGAFVSIDGETYQSTTPFVVNQILMGEHVIEITHPEYASDKQRIYVEENKLYHMPYSLQQEADVTLRTDPDAAIALVSLNGHVEFLGEGSWSGKMSIGQYTIITSRSGYRDASTVVNITKSDTYYVKGPQKMSGTLVVRSNSDKNSVYIDNEYKGTAPWSGSLSIGNHTVKVSREGFYNSVTQSVSIEDGKSQEIRLIPERMDFSSPKHHFELLYGTSICNIKDVTKNNIDHVVGMSYNYIPRRWGLNINCMYGIRSQGLSLTMGPTLRMTPSCSSFNLQLVLGAGAIYNFDNSRKYILNWAVDGGLRFSFEPEDDFAWYSFSLGLRYADGYWTPTAGLSLMPARWLALAVKEIPYVDIEHFAEFTTGIVFGSSLNWMVGATYAWVPSCLGLYITGMGGEDAGSIVAGPAFRLTPNTKVFDLHFYQGVGWTYADGEHYCVGDSGLRWAFDYDGRGFCLFSLTTGVQYSSGMVAPVFGMSVALVGLLGTAGIGAAWL